MHTEKERFLIMGKFREYARRMDRLARSAFEQYTEAENALEKAKAARKEYPLRGGAVTADYHSKALRAQADYEDALHKFNSAQQDLGNHNKEIREIRDELKAALAEEYGASPSAIDANTLELLKSGILTPNEYVKLGKKASEDGNYTMERLISKFANDAAEAEEQRNNGKENSMSMAYRAASIVNQEDYGSTELAKFDVMVTAYQTTANNPYMIQDWDSLTAEAAECL